MATTLGMRWTFRASARNAKPVVREVVILPGTYRTQVALPLVPDPNAARLCLRVLDPRGRRLHSYQVVLEGPMNEDDAGATWVLPAASSGCLTDLVPGTYRVQAIPQGGTFGLLLPNRPLTVTLRPHERAVLALDVPQGGRIRILAHGMVGNPFPSSVQATITVARIDNPRGDPWALPAQDVPCDAAEECHDRWSGSVRLMDGRKIRLPAILEPGMYAVSIATEERGVFRMPVVIVAGETSLAEMWFDG